MPQRQILVEHTRVADFFPVVILGIDPEDRARRRAVLSLNAPGQLDGGDRFEKRVERPAKKTRLLAGDDGATSGIVMRGGVTLAARVAPLLALASAAWVLAVRRVSRPNAACTSRD